MSENFAAEIKAINDLRAKYQEKHRNDKVEHGNDDETKKNSKVITQDYQRPYIDNDALSEVPGFPDVDQRDPDLFDETAMNSNQLKNVEEKTNSDDYNHDHDDDHDRNDGNGDDYGNGCDNSGSGDSRDSSECERESEDEDDAKQEILETDSSIAINEVNRNLRKGAEQQQREEKVQAHQERHGSAHVRSAWKRANRQNIGNNEHDEDVNNMGGSSRQSGSSYESRSNRRGGANSNSDQISVRQRGNRNEKEKEQENRGSIAIDYNCGNVDLSYQSLQSIDSNDNDHGSKYSKNSNDSNDSLGDKHRAAPQSVYSSLNSNDNCSNDYNNNNDNDDVNNNYDNDLEMVLNIQMNK